MIEYSNLLAGILLYIYSDSLLTFAYIAAIYWDDHLEISLIWKVKGKRNK